MSGRDDPSDDLARDEGYAGRKPPPGRPMPSPVDPRRRTLLRALTVPLLLASPEIGRTQPDRLMIGVVGAGRIGGTLAEL